MVLVVIFWYLALAFHLRWDHRRRPTRAAEVTYQTATTIFCGLQALPDVIENASRLPAQGYQQGTARLTIWQASLLVLPLYATIPYSLIIWMNRKKRHIQQGGPAYPPQGVGSADP